MSDVPYDPLPPEVLGVNGLDPFVKNTSAARKAMFASHIGQAPIVSDNEPRRIFAGTEFKFAQETFDVKFPCDATVLNVINKYPVGQSRDSIRENPEVTIIYEDYYCPYRTIGVLHLPKYGSYHQEFGFPYIVRDDIKQRLVPGETFEKDTVIATSTAVKANGGYGMGAQAEVAFMSHPGTIEDGMVMSESFLKRMTPTTYTTLVGSWGKRNFPLNLYGDETYYKPFPDIGETIHPSGLVMAFRQINPETGIAEMTPRALRTVDHSYDRPLWGKGSARVVDIKVYHDDRLNPSFTPVGMDTHARKYYDALAHYYRQLLNKYNELKRKRGNTLRITPQFNRLLVEAQLYLPVERKYNEEKLPRKLTRTHRLETMDEWRVELTFAHDLPTDEGYKMTDTFGGKGVACKVLETSEMPIDRNGNRADILIYGMSTINRTNVGRLYEQFFNAASRDLLHRLRKEVGLDPHLTPTAYQVKVATQDPEWLSYAHNELLEFYSLLSPPHYDIMKDHPSPEKHVGEILTNGMYIYHPPGNLKSPLDAVRDVQASRFAVNIGPVTYTNAVGEEVVTDHPVMIGQLYILMLEKTGEDWSAAASVKVQHYGVPAKLNQFDRHTSPARQTAVRGLGESETRSWGCTVGPVATVDMLDQSNNPNTHRNVIENIMQANKPTDIERVVDRKKVPLGGSRPVNFVNHIMACRGIKFTYVPDHGDR